MLKRLQLLLITLLVILQYQLWLGENNRFDTRRMEQALVAQQAELAADRARNLQLMAEVKDLQTGFEAHEELARSELGYIRNNEIFFRVIE